MILRLSFDLPQAVSYIGHLRRTCRCFLEYLHIGDKDVDDIELILGELATNAVRHAKGIDSYHVAIEFFDDHAVVIVSDNGINGFPPHLYPSGTARADTLSEMGEDRFGGWGLPLIYSIADQVEIMPTIPNGTTVRAEKRFRAFQKSAS